MAENTSDEWQHQTSRDRESLRTALGTMSVDQLRRVRSTIMRLKHLPYAKLVAALFTEPAANEDGSEESADVYEDQHAFVQDFRGHCGSERMHALFEDVENILERREREEGQ